MKKSFLFLFTMISLSAMSQSRLGSSLDSIKAEVARFPNYRTLLNLNKDNTYAFHYLGGELECGYLFDENQICTMCSIKPLNQGKLNWYVERYNSNYVIVSKTKWKAYLPDGVCDIVLNFEKGSMPYFIWTLSE